MPSIERSALVNYSVEQMFDLVNDIESYPLFMQGCKAARILSRTRDEMVGELTLAQAGMQQSFTTRNSLHRPQRIDMRLVSGKFRHFAACWEFCRLGGNACKMRLRMQFELDFSVVSLAAGRLFDRLADAQVDAMVARADAVYGS